MSRETLLLPHAEEGLNQGDDTGSDEQRPYDLTLSHVVLSHTDGWCQEEWNRQSGDKHRDIVLKVIVHRTVYIQVHVC